MSTSTDKVNRPAAPSTGMGAGRRRRGRVSQPGLSLLAQGEPMVWLTGGALVICLVMIFGLLALVFWYGSNTFWPRAVVRVELLDGTVHMGEVSRDHEEYIVTLQTLEQSPRAIQKKVHEQLGEEVDVRLPAEHADVEVTEILVAPEQVIDTVTEVAKVRTAAGEETVTSRHAGRVMTVYAEAGQTVSGGAPLIRIRTSMFVSLGDFGEELSDVEVIQVHVKPGQDVDRGGDVVTFKTLDGEIVVAKSPYKGTVMQVFAQEQQIIEKPDTVVLKINTEGELQMVAQRRQFRTGNFKITNRHASWVSDFEIVPGSEEKPAWVIVVERLEWGRFYGIPNEFAVRHKRPVPEEEQQLLDMLQLLEAGVNRLPYERQDAVRDAVQPVREKYEKIRLQNVREFLGQFSEQTGKRLDAVLDGDQVVPVNAVPDGQNVIEIQEVWLGAAAAWSKFEEHHDAVRERFRQRQQLQTDDIGRLNRVEDQAWLQMRQAELDLRDVDPQTGKRIQTVFVRNAAEDVLTAQNEIDAIRRDAEKNAAAVAAIRKEFGSNSTVAQAASEIKKLLDAQIDEFVQTPEARVAELKAFVDAAPRLASDAVKEYWRTKSELLDERAAIIDEMRELDAENARFELRMVTTSREPLFNAAVESPRQMSSGGTSVPVPLREAFELYGVPLGSEVEVRGNDRRRRWEFVDKTDPQRPQTYYVHWKDGQFEVAKAIERALSLGDIVRAYPANQLSLGDKLGIYFSRWGEFLWDNPREANSAGGVFPAIWGTVAMTIIMSLFVVPFGVLAALYLREYARAGAIVSAVRISINNLAGVPSIVFGVFGYGFFVAKMGAFIDGGPEHAGFSPWPEAGWFGLVGAMVAAAVAAFFTGVFSMTKKRGDSSKLRLLFGKLSIGLWLVMTVLVILVVFGNPFFSGFYEAELTKHPTFGKGGLLWASLTLALLTLPVVIVATEEALSAVPNSLREGSYACGASKWQTIRRVVLPHAMPGIMTGMILAMARGAGEVAPLMLVGAKKLTDKLPVDSVFPYVHLDRDFMHLGFHIYDVGFQSQDSEGSRPLVFTTTLLLIAIIAFLNLSAIWLRSRLRKRFQASHF